jgi:hypothetical protein
VLLAAPGALPLDAQLRITPAEPAPGAELHLAYSGPLAAGAADTLKLRARLRSDGDEWYNRGPLQRTVALLVRGDDGVFRGAFRLPEEAVYGTFAVENADGSGVDHNAGHLWDVSVRGADGRPLFAALGQRLADAIGRSWDITYETATAMTELYPERVRSWERLASLQGWLLPPAALDSVRVGHRQRVAEFHEAFAARDDVDPAQLEALISYHWTSGVGAVETMHHWQRRLDDEHPRHPYVLMFARQDALGRTFAGQPDRYLRAVEPLWEQLLEQEDAEAGLRWAMTNNALNVAHRAEDPAWFVTWLTRYRTLPNIDPFTVAGRAAAGVRRAELRPFVLDVLRETAALLATAPDAYRPLDRTVAEHRLDQVGPLAQALALHATALLAHGDSGAALDTLAAATRLAWEPGVWRTLAQLRLGAGDGVGAMHALAAVAVDPNTPAVFADSAATRLGAHFDSAAWQAALDSARGTMRRLVLARATDQPLPATITLRGDDGTDRSLRELGAGRPLVLVFWEASCGFSRMALPEIQRVAAWTAERGSRLVLVTSDPLDAEARALIHEKAGEHPAFALVHDHAGLARRALPHASFPRYYVLNAAGRVVFAGTGSNTIPRIPLEVSALGF